MSTISFTVLFMRGATHENNSRASNGIVEGNQTLKKKKKIDDIFYKYICVCESSTEYTNHGQKSM